MAAIPFGITGGTKFMPTVTVVRADIRVMGPTGMEDYYAHLLRLDDANWFPVPAGRSLDTHCLRLLTAGAILVGAYVDGVMRAAAEIVPDQTARQAEAVITIEQGFDDRELGRMLTERIVDEARRYHFSKLRVLEKSTASSIQIAPDRHYAVNG
jgi:hypothetical protein